MNREELRDQLADKKMELAELCSEALQLAAQNETELNILLSKHINDYIAVKKNIGQELAVLMLMADLDEAKVLYSYKEKNHAIAKGLQLKINAIDSKIFTLKDLIELERGIV
jgi:hypothetical protein